MATRKSQIVVACFALFCVLNIASATYLRSSTYSYLKNIEDFFQRSAEVSCSKAAPVEELPADTMTVSFSTFDPNPFSRQVAVGKAIWAFDAMDPLMETPFRTEADAGWSFFQSQPSEGDNPYYPNGDKPADVPTLLPYEKVKSGMLASKWVVSTSSLSSSSTDPFKKALDSFDENGDHSLSYREFTLLTIERFAGKGDSTCTNCLVDSRKKLSALFQYMDCDEDGYVDAKDLWGAFGVMETFKLNTTANTNDLLLNCDKDQDGRLNRQEFVEGTLHGYWERMVGPDGLTDDYVQMRQMRADQYDTRRAEEEQKIAETGVDFSLSA